MSLLPYVVPSEKLVHRTLVEFGSKRLVQNQLHFVQYDRELALVEVALYSNGSKYYVPELGSSCKIRWKKPDRTFVYKDVLGCDETRHLIYFEVDEQMTYVKGEINAILELTINGCVAGSSPLNIVIDANPIQENDIESAIEMPLAQVAFTGDFYDLTNVPDLPDVSNLVQKSGDTMTGSLLINHIQGRSIHPNSNLLLTNNYTSSEDNDYSTYLNLRSETNGFVLGAYDMGMDHNEDPTSVGFSGIKGAPYSGLGLYASWNGSGITLYGSGTESSGNILRVSPYEGITINNYHDINGNGYYQFPLNDGSTSTNRYTLATVEKSVQKSGDTMTGDLNMNGGNVVMENVENIGTLQELHILGKVNAGKTTSTEGLVITLDNELIFPHLKGTWYDGPGPLGSQEIPVNSVYANYAFTVVRMADGFYKYSNERNAYFEFSGGYTLGPAGEADIAFGGLVLPVDGRVFVPLFTEEQHAALLTKASQEYIQKSGDTMTGPLNITYSGDNMPVTELKVQSDVASGKTTIHSGMDDSNYVAVQANSSNILLMGGVSTTQLGFINTHNNITTLFNFPDENGTKTIATREWAGDNYVSKSSDTVEDLTTIHRYFHHN